MTSQRAGSKTHLIVQLITFSFPAFGRKLITIAPILSRAGNTSQMIQILESETGTSFKSFFLQVGVLSTFTVTTKLIESSNQVQT